MRNPFVSVLGREAGQYPANPVISRDVAGRFRPASIQPPAARPVRAVSLAAALPPDHCLACGGTLTRKGLCPLCD